MASDTLEQAIRKDCPGISFVSDRKLGFESFYGAAATNDSISEFWQEPRVFALPADIGVSCMFFVICN